MTGPSLAEPGDHHGVGLLILVGEDAGVEEGVEEEEEVAGDLFEDVEEPGEYRHVDPERVGVGVVLVLKLRLAWVQGVTLSGDRVQGVPLYLVKTGDGLCFDLYICTFLYGSSFCKWREVFKPEEKVKGFK